MNVPLAVRILNGPHEGAEMEIPQEGITLGRDDTCDLIIFDPYLTPRHLRLVPQDGGKLILSPLEGNVQVGGIQINEDTVVESPTQVITVGETQLAVGHAGQEWPTVAWPLAHQMPEDLVASALPSLTTTLRGKKNLPRRIFLGSTIVLFLGFATYFAYREISKKTPTSLTSSAQRFRDVLPISPFWKKFLPSRFSSAKSASSQSSVASKTPQYFTVKPASSRSSGAASSMTLLEAQVSRSLLKKVPNIVFSVNELEGRKQFDIWVRGEEAATAVRRILNQASPPLSYRITDLAQVESSALTLAQLFGLSIQVHMEPEGIAIWSGYQLEDKNWRNFSVHVIRELSAIRDQRCEIVFGTELVPKLRQELQQQGYPDVRPIASEEGIRLEGVVPKGQKLTWKDWVEQLQGKYASQVSITDCIGMDTVAKMSLKEYFPSQVVGISGAIMPWISLADGSKLFPGAKLKRGYILEAIAGNTLRLEGPEGTLNFSLSTL